MDYLALLESGIDNWNKWRSQHPEEVCDLSNQNLSEGYFVKGNFQNVRFIGSQLHCACFIGANLQGAKFCHADLTGAYMGEANLQGADLTGATLTETNLNRADLRQAILTDTDISAANTYRAKFSLGVALDELKSADLKKESAEESTTSKDRQPDIASTPIYVAQRDTAKKETIQKDIVKKETTQKETRQKSVKVSTSISKVSERASDTALEVVTPSPESKLSLKRSVAIWLSAMIVAASLLGLSLLVLGIVPLGSSVDKATGTRERNEAEGRVEADSRSQTPSEQTQTDEPSRLSLTRSIQSDAQVWAIATYTNLKGKPVIVSGDDKGDIALWDQRTGESAGSLAGHTDTVRDIAVSDSGRWIVSGSGDGIKVWDAERNQLAYNLAAEDSPIWAVAISPSERVFVSADYDGKMTVWQLESGKAIYSMEHGASVWDLAIAPDGQTFVSSSSDRTIIQWDLVSGEPLQTFGGDEQGHQDVVRAVAISPDGKTLASGSWDSTIKLWSLESGDLLATLAGHDARVVSVAISPDGKTLASGGTDNLLQYWDVSKRELIETVDSSANWILDVTFARTDEPGVDDKTTLVSGGKDQRIHVWQPE